MVHLDFSNGAEMRSNFSKAFLIGHLSEGLIHFKALLFFFLGCDSKILLGCADYAGVDTNIYIHCATFKEFEEHLGMTEFIVGCFTEYLTDGEIVFLVGLGGIELIARIRH